MIPWNRLLQANCQISSQYLLIHFRTDAGHLKSACGPWVGLRAVFWVLPNYIAIFLYIVTPRMERYPMVEMELLVWWYRGHIREYNKTKIIQKFLVNSKIQNFYWKHFNKNIYTKLEKIYS